MAAARRLASTGPGPGIDPGLRAAAGHEVLDALHAVRRAVPEGGVQEGRRVRVGPERARRPAEAAVAGRAVPRPGREGDPARPARRRPRASRSRTSPSGRGAKVIDYDRLVVGSKASYYVSFDNVQGRQAQGKGLVAALKANGKYSKKPVVSELNGDIKDNNAKLFKQGYDSVLNPLYKNGRSRRRTAATSGPTGIRSRAGGSSTRSSPATATRSTRRSRRTTASPAPSSRR